MKKVTLIIMFILILLLSSCTAEQAEIDCNQSTTKNNELCERFKTISLLGDDIFYDVNFYQYDESADINWMDVLYQNKIFFNRLVEYEEANIIRFDASNLVIESGNTGSVKVVYNDGQNQEISKMFFVSVVDVTEISLDDTINSIPILDSITLSFPEGTVTIDSLNDNHYSISIQWGDVDIRYVGYIYRHVTYDLFENHELRIRTSYLGYKLEIISNVGLDTESKELYSLFHVDNNRHREKSFLNIEEDIFLSVDVEENLQFNLLDLYYDSSFIVKGEVEVYKDDSLLSTGSFSFEEDNEFIKFQNLTTDYIVHVELFTESKVWFLIYNQDRTIWYSYVLEPNSQK